LAPCGFRAARVKARSAPAFLSWVVRRTDDSAVRRVFEQQKGREVGLLLTSISPDSKTLLFHQQELVDMVERPPLTPEGFVPGFVRVDLDAFTSEPVPHLEGFVAWTHDGRGVFDVREEGAQSRLEAFLRGTQIVWSRLGGTALVEVTSSGGYADLQRPKLSPSGTHLAYLSRQSVAVVDLADIDGSWHVVWKCSSRCQFAWTDDMGLLVLEDEVLYSVRRGGGWVVAREGIAGFSMGGEPRVARAREVRGACGSARQAPHPESSARRCCMGDDVGPAAERRA
jgi:hypothetical protein